MGGGESGIAGGGDLKIALRQFVGVLRTFDDSAIVDDGSIGTGDLRHQAAMGGAHEPVLDGVGVAIYVRCVIDVEEAAKERPGVILPVGNCDGLVVGRPMDCNRSGC